MELLVDLYSDDTVLIKEIFHQIVYVIIKRKVIDMEILEFLIIENCLFFHLNLFFKIFLKLYLCQSEWNYFFNKFFMARFIEVNLFKSIYRYDCNYFV